MAKQTYWEDISENSEVTPIEKIATTQMLVRWAGASGDFNPLHFDEAFSNMAGVGKPIVHGALKRQWLVQLVTSWMGAEGTMKKFSCQYRGMDWPRAMQDMENPQDGETWKCAGVVSKKYEEGEEHLVDLEIWVENGKGEKTTRGSATVVLPSGR